MWFSILFIFLILLALYILRSVFFPAAKKALTPDYLPYPLQRVLKLSHNTAVYRFTLPTTEHILGLPIGQHIQVAIETPNENGEKIVTARSYTPTSSETQKGHFDLMVKTYPGGVVSSKIQALQIGDTIKVRGPKGQFHYQPNMCKRIGMIAGGTGIAPMLQIIKAIIHNQKDKTRVDLIFANVTLDDILLKDELDSIAEKFDNFNVYYVLNQPPEPWAGGTGYVNVDMIKHHLPPPNANIKILLCGPPPMVAAMTRLTKEIGYEVPRAVSKIADQVFKF